MSEMSFGDFQKPSELGGGGPRPTLTQLLGRLVHIFPTRIDEGVTSPLKATPHTRAVCDVTFLDGPAIGEVLNKHGQISATLTPAVQAGQVMTDVWLSQGWFASRLAKSFNKPGWPGLLGVVGKQAIPGKADPMFVLLDPTPAQADLAKGWFQQVYITGANRYEPAPVAPVGAPPVQPAYATSPPAPASPWAPGAAPAQAPAAPPVQPAAALPPWAQQG